MSLKELAQGRKEELLISIKELTIKEGFNVRTDYGDMQELAKSIAENGVRVPLRIRSSEDGKPIVVDGHRRLRAIEIANEKYGGDIKAVYCTLEGRGTNEQERLIDVLICNDGKPLEDIEKAAVIKRLLDKGWKGQDIAKRMGKSNQWLNETLKLLEADPETRKALEEKRVKPSVVKELQRKSTKPEVKEKIKKEMAEGKTVKSADLRAAANKFKAPAKGLIEKARARALKEAEATTVLADKKRWTEIADTLGWILGECELPFRF